MTDVTLEISSSARGEWLVSVSSGLTGAFLPGSAHGCSGAGLEQWILHCCECHWSARHATQAVHWMSWSDSDVWDGHNGGWQTVRACLSRKRPENISCGA